MAFQRENFFHRRTKPKGPRTNEKIRAPEVQVIDSYGKNADEAYNKRNKILAESFKYMKEKTKGLNF